MWVPGTELRLSGLVVRASTQLGHLCLPNLEKNFLCLSLSLSLALSLFRHFHFCFETGLSCFVQAGPELLDSNNPPASAS